jgi:ATP-dependent Lhr-like helicase
MPLSLFHPLTRRWFEGRFIAPTPPQRDGWPAIASGRDALIAAPTGSGKTLAAFLYGIDGLLRAALAGTLEDRTYILYVSPLRALSNDVQRNLQVPLAELLELARQEKPDCPEIRALVRTGDTSTSERARMLRKPPHILVTTPESLYLVLTGARSRKVLRGVQTVIVDEIHALARDKRGSHLGLSLERLTALCGKRPVRVGLSATQKPIERIAEFLSGMTASGSSRETMNQEAAQIIDSGHARDIDLAVEVPKTPLQAVCSNDQWGEVYERLIELIRTHRSTLIFVNTRRWAERVARQLSDRLGEDAVASHHGSLAHPIRQKTEERLKRGDLKCVVATASLEMGIDVGHVDLVCQLGTPRSIATFLQRVGRAGHSLGALPKGRLFALTRDELLECLALVRAAYAGRLDRIEIPKAPLDVLAQQIVAATACDEWGEEELYQLFRQSYSYRDLSRDDYDEVVTMLSEGVASRRGRSGAFLHRDRVAGRLRARRGARMTAITCGGAIPEVADYRVVVEDEARTVIGSVHEDFAIESMAGDVFLLGNTSWQVRHVRGGEVVVRDAQGAPPTVPFWLGEAPGRTIELSEEVGLLREDIAARCPAPSAETSEQAFSRNPEGMREQGPGFDEIHSPGEDAAAHPFGIAAKRAVAEAPCITVAEDDLAWLMRESRVSREGAHQAFDYVGVQKAATGMVPTQKRIFFERFFDESGGMQLVVHAPFGTRITRAWGLAMRKCFCRTFDFELQAAAGDNGIVLSLGPQHSFPLEQMYTLVRSSVARDMLVQALLAVPFFTTRWRWNATRALAVRRSERGRRVPPPLQRFRADDLLSAVFPQQTGCLENVVGDIEVPDHPLVRQTMDDCLFEACDLEGWLNVLRQLEAGELEVVGLDTREPSPFSHELLNANPYAFLDDAPLEERRARAVSLRRTLSPEIMRDLARLDPAAIDRVRSEAWPLVRDADELHDALLTFGVLPASEGKDWQTWFEELRGAGRAAVVQRGAAEALWVTAERWPMAQAVWPEAHSEPGLSPVPGVRTEWDSEEAVLEIVRGRLDHAGPLTAQGLGQLLGIDARDVLRALLALELQGTVLRGKFTPESIRLTTDDELAIEWCERRLLARIHRLTLEGLRKQIEPVPPEQFLRYLARHQHALPVSRLRGQAGLLEVIEQLQGFEAPAGHWEKYLLPTRVENYDPAWLDMLTLTGYVAWGRLCPTRRSEDRARPAKALTRNIPITLMLRRDLPWLLEKDPAIRGRQPPEVARGAAAAPADDPLAYLSGNAREAHEALARHGALFADQLMKLMRTVQGQVEDALAELAAAGLVTCDGFAPLRGIIGSATSSRRQMRQRRPPPRPTAATVGGGRWCLLSDVSLVEADATAPRVENWCRLLLRRYGVVFRDLMSREAAAPPWFELLRAFRNMEARGEVRGGRFVAGVAGEQYALSESVSRLRQIDDDATRMSLSATDPLNLSGRATSGPKIPATPGNRILVEGGRLIAYKLGDEVRHLDPAAGHQSRSKAEGLLG